MQPRFFLLLILAARAHACSCSGNWPSVKQAWENVPYVFLGTVEAADPDEPDSQTIFREQSVRIRVDDAFKGVTAGQIIQLREAGTDCDAKFRTGQRAVFYLVQGSTPGSWSVPACTHSLGNAAPFGDDLLFLQQLPKSAVGTRLSGEVELYENSAREGFRRVGGVPNVSVRISGREGSIHALTTNSDGAYELYNLPPGRYSVSIKAPKGLRTALRTISGSSTAREVELATNGGVSVDFVLEADTRLSGRMLDAKNQPIPHVCLTLEPVEGRGEDGSSFFNCSKASGMFEMEMMPAGKYWLVARDDIKKNQIQSKSTLYYPGVRDRSNARMISIEAGKYLKDLDLRLPSDEKRYQFTGRMRFEDGVLASGATVTFTSPRHGYAETTGTAEDGSFGLWIVAGMEGQLDGQMPILMPILKSCPDVKVKPRTRGLFALVDANPIPLSSDSDRDGLELVLSSPSCKAGPPVQK